MFQDNILHAKRILISAICFKVLPKAMLLVKVLQSNVSIELLDKDTFLI